MEEKTLNQARSVKSAIDHAVSHTKEVNQVLTQAGNKAMETAHKRLKEGIDECANMVSKVHQSVSR